MLTVKQKKTFTSIIRIAAFSFFGVNNLLLAKPYFNPSFLSSDAGSVADLSRFERGNNQLPGVYRVDIYANGEFITTHDVLFNGNSSGKKGSKETFLDEHISLKEEVKSNDSGLVPCLTPQLLHRVNINFRSIPILTDFKDNQCIPVKKIMPELTTSFDFEDLKFNINIPQIFLESSVRGYIPPKDWDEGVNAGIFNYNFSGSNGSDSQNYFLGLQSGLNIGPWRLRNNGSWSYSDANGTRSSRWENINTYVERAIIPLKSELVIGDNNSDNTLFDSYGFRGMRMYSVDGMYPDSQRGYAPTIRGIAGGRSKVTVRQNGYVIYQMFVSAGPFEIKDLNPTSSSGDLNVTVEEQGGNTQKYTVPYSSVPLLQREGRINYDLVIGKYRSGNDQQSDLKIIQGTVIAGINNGVTVYGGTQLAERYQSVALGIGGNLGTWGALSMDLTQSRSKLTDGSIQQGQSLRFLYAKSLNDYGTNIQLLGYRYSTRGFYTLSDVAYNSMEGYEYEYDDEDGDQHKVPVLINYHNLNQSKRGRVQVSVSQHLQDWGSLYLSGNQQSYWNTSAKDSWYQFGFSTSWLSVSYNLSLSYSKSVGRQDSDRIAALTVSIPLGQYLSSVKDIYSTTNFNRASDGSLAAQTGVSGTLLDDRSLSYGVYEGYNENYGNTGSANVNWRGRYATANVGYNYDKSGHQWNYLLSGGVIAHADGITLSQPLGDTNVLVKAPGAKDVSVENGTGIKTDWRGYAVMPYATVYRLNRIALNTNTLDEHTDIEDSVSNVVPTQGALVRADFKTQVGLRALIILKFHDRVVPFGATVTDKGGRSASIVGDGGQVYMSGLPMSGLLESKWGNGEHDSCKASYRFSAEDLKETVTQKVISCAD